MAGASELISIDYAGKDIRSALRRLHEVTGNLEPAFRDIGEYLLESHQARFDDQVDPEGNEWEPLQEKTKKRKKRNKDKILIEYGNYLRSLHYEVGGDMLEFGTNDIRGATLQFGDEKRGIPAREHIGISDRDESEILDIVEQHILSGIESGA